MYWVYVLKSSKTGRHYIGSSADVARRIERHNRGGNKSTKNGIPWTLVYKESFGTSQEAYRREMQIKRFRGGEAFNNLLK